MGFYERIAHEYDAWSSHVTNDIDFYVSLARNAEGRLLELAVGDGRVAVPVAQATSQQVTGIDSSPGMLEQARARAAAADVDLDLRLGDMRDFNVEVPCSLIYCPGRSLLHIPTWTERRRVFEHVAASLQPGGVFAWNAYAFDHQLAAQLDGRHQTRPTPHVNHYDIAENRIDMVLDNGASTSLWWATKNEWLGLIEVAGLQLDALYGDFNGSALSSDSRKYVFATRLP
ncbi:MAG: class I SAM-dependent methyltransferase [Acidimicrobiales bacterium]